MSKSRQQAGPASPARLLESAAGLEVAASLLQLLLWPAGRIQRRVPEQARGRARPVVLVHGYGAGPAAMLPVELALHYVGFDRVFPFSYSTAGQAGIESLAESLSEHVARVAGSCGGQTVDLVCHSLGGLVARCYLQQFAGHRLVDQCITLATPHLGTYSSYWAPTAVGRQLRPDADFLARLNHTAARAPGVRYHSLGGELDLLVLPRENALYPQGSGRLLPGVGHNGILLHPRALRLVIERLRAGQDMPSSRLERLVQLSGGVWRRLARQQ